MDDHLYMKDLFLNKNILFLFNKEIVEYDMSEAGFSIIQEYHLLTDKEIDSLKKLGKAERKIKIGKLQNKKPDLKEGLKLGFRNCRKMFYDTNELTENDIISIKKDAIFSYKHCTTTKFGKHINFRPKHIYTSYIQISKAKGVKTLEFYYSPSEVSIKGIDDKLLEDHYNEGMIKFLKDFCNKMETSNNIDAIQYVRRFIDKYKRMELPVSCYRTFNPDFNYVELGTGDRYMEYWEDKKEQLDISYNYMNILLQIIKIPL